MSISKEPRQLMINLMYIVLLALLALNVSAEIMNAFFALDNSLNESSRVVASSNQQIVEAINQQADAYAQFEPYKEKVAQIQNIANTFYEQVEQLKNDIVNESGGYDEHHLPAKKKNKDVPTRILLTEGKGEQLKTDILAVKASLLDLVDEETERQVIAKNIPLQIAEIPADSDKKNWSQLMFQQMPVAAVLPLLSKFQNDVKIAETTLLNHFFNKMNISVIPDKFTPVVAANTSYVIQGEEFKSEMFLAAYSSTANNINVKVDGRSYPVRDGKAIFTTNPSSIGNKTHQMEISIANPLTGEVETYKKKFSYEVGQRSVAVSADKMNVFYVGVDNPISVSAAGVSSRSIKVVGEGVELRRDKNGKYIAKPRRPGQAKIIVSGAGLEPTVFDYRVKRIPDPSLRLGNKSGGTISKAELQVYKGIIPFLDHFDFEAKCKVMGFEMTRVPKNDDVRVTLNKGGTFGSEAQRIIKGARSGDVFYFDKVKVKCPGDAASRSINGMIFNIK